MKKKSILIVLLACFAALFSAQVQAQESVLFLCNEKEADYLIVDSLTSYGYTVTVVAQNDFRDTYTTLDKFAGFDVFVVAESISSDRANNFAKLGYPLPCLTMEGYAPREGKWSWYAAADEANYYMNYGNSKGTGVDGIEAAMTMVVEDNSHYITKEYAVKEEVAWSVSPDWLGAEFVCLKLETLIPGAIALASSKATEFAGFSPLWAIPENSPVPDTTSVFAHRMVLFPHHVKLIDLDEATPEFYNIIKRSITWVLKKDVVVAPPVAKNVLFLCNEKDADYDIVDSLTSYGYVVTVVAQNTFRDEYITLDKFDGFDAFVIAESISSDRANNFEILGYPLPCLNMEGYTPRPAKWEWYAEADADKYYMNYGASSGTGPDGIEAAMTMVIEDNSHYITEEYAVKEEVEWSVSPDWLGAEFICLKLETLIPGAIALASSKATEFDGFSPLWAIPANSPVPDTTSVFAHRMVIYPHHIKLIGVDKATDEFYNIIKRSMTWILKEDGTSAIVNTKANALDVALVGNPVSDFATFKLASDNTGAVSVTVLNLNGQVVLSQDQSASAGNVIEVSTSSLSNGLYLYTVACDGKVSTGKMLVRK